jgi:hypothetical protein
MKDGGQVPPDAHKISGVSWGVNMRYIISLAQMKVKQATT